jgi:hypothetical protein
MEFQIGLHDDICAQVLSLSIPYSSDPHLHQSNTLQEASTTLLATGTGILVEVHEAIKTRLGKIGSHLQHRTVVKFLVKLHFFHLSIGQEAVRQIKLYNIVGRIKRT